MPNDTHYFASVSGDRYFIEWLVARLIYKYKEDPNTDFVQTLKKFAIAGELLREAEKATFSEYQEYLHKRLGEVQ